MSLVAKTTRIQVYALGGSTRRGTADYVGCDPRTHRLTQLSQYSGGIGESASRPIVHGRYAALSLTLNAARDPFGPTNVIRAWDVVAGRRIVDDVERYTGSGVPHADPSDPPSSFQINDRGDVAWIAGHATGDPLIDVRLVPRRQPVRLLDSAPDVAPDSLALTQGYVYWQRGGAPQVDPISPSPHGDR